APRSTPSRCRTGAHRRLRMLPRAGAEPCSFRSARDPMGSRRERAVAPRSRADDAAAVGVRARPSGSLRQTHRAHTRAGDEPARQPVGAWSAKEPRPRWIRLLESARSFGRAASLDGKTMDILFDANGVHFLLRWLHFLAGITWIGMLYYFNFVQT